MPQAKFVVKCSGTYGKVGQVVILPTEKLTNGELTDRQKIMLKPYVEPEVNDLTDGANDDDQDDKPMTKDQIAAKLKELGIEFNPADKKEVLAALLPK